MTVREMVEAAATAAALLLGGYMLIVMVLSLDAAAPLYGGR